MKNRILLFTLVATLIILASCEKNLEYKQAAPNLPETPLDYEMMSSFGVPMLQDADDNKATLGRVLFYDKKLSINNRTACASCHLQSAAFSDNVDFSQGFRNDKTLRNASTIVNTGTQFSFFWDSRSHNLTDMVLMPISDHIEMGLEELDDLETKLKATSYYPALFEKAYGTTEIKKQQIADALATFVNTINSYNSRFDQYSQTGNTDNFSADELAGLQIFNNSNCNSCHGGFDLRGSWGDDWANIGLDMDYGDNGLGDLSGSELQNGQFKVPTLRNIALTAPYMHDGRFETLRDVIKHYSENIQPHTNLDGRLMENNAPRRLNLSDQEIDQLIAFLNTLTDHTFINDERYSDPFED